MTRKTTRAARRAGFTLVELLIVIAIIAVLISLLAAAVFKVTSKADELKARHDLSNLAVAIQNFQTTMGVDYIPSRFRLREKIADYLIGIANQDQLDKESYDYLKKLFPKLLAPSQANPNPVIDWNNNGVADEAVDLEGHQCLVFFLGGIVTYGPNTCTGFSTKPSDPSILGGERIGPFYNDFKSDRLVILPTPPVSYATFPATGAANPAPSYTNGMHGPKGTPAPGYFSYFDPWAKDGDLQSNRTPVYAYFSSYKKNNGYNRYYAYYFNNPALASLTFDGLPITNITSDCSSLLAEDSTQPGKRPPVLAAGVWPYSQKVGQTLPATPEYLNRNTFQLICAGPDKVFGQGTRLVVNATNMWTTSSYFWTPQSTGILPPGAQDDFSNFHDRQLGSGD